MTVEKVSIKPRRVSLTADGVLTDFDFDFKIFNENDILVYVLDTSDVATLQTITTDYTVTFDSEAETGTITFLTPPTDQYTVLMISNTDYEQSTDIPKGGGFSEPVVEKGYDLLEIQIQQLKDEVDRCVQLTETSLLTSVTLPDPEAGAPIGWNDTADGLTNNPDNIHTVKVDTDATPDFIGATAGDGVLRTGGLLNYADGGDFVTISLTNADIDHDQLTNYLASEHYPAIDEDDMVSDSDTSVPTQQSVRAYVLSQIGGNNEYTELLDTPSAYTGDALEFLRVNAGETGIEHIAITASLVPIVDAGGIITATDVEGALQENRTAIDLNTAKVTNQTHTGDVTGSVALTVQPAAITGKPSGTVASGDLVLIADVDDSNNLKYVTAGTIGALGGSGFSDPMTTRGDIIIRDATNTTARLGVGTAGQVLTSDGTDISWGAGGGGGATLTESVAQATHGFSVGDWIYHNGTIYALADASAAGTAESIGVVSAVADANNFTVQFGGKVTGLSGLTAGEAHFLSETAGAITATAPATEGAIVKPVLIADSTTTGFIFNMRGVAVTNSTSFYTSFTNADLSAGVLTVNHNLGHKYATIQVFNNSDKQVMPDDITLVDNDNASVDLTSFGTLTGTWHVVVLDVGTTTAYSNTTYEQTFTNSDLSAGVLTINHSLSDQYPIIQVYDENNQIVVPDNITATGTGTATVDLSSFGTISGTWRAILSAIGGTAATSPTPTSLVQTFTSGSLVAGILTVNHGFGTQYCVVDVFDNNDEKILPDAVDCSGLNSLTVDLSSFTVTGNWRVVVLGPGAFSSNIASDLNLTGQAAEDTTFFNGTSWVPVGGTEKIIVGHFQRTAASGTGTQAVTGLGFKPSAIVFLMTRPTGKVTSQGFDDGTNRRSQYVQADGTNNWTYVNTQAITYNDGTNVYYGNISSFDSNGFTIQWTVVGGSPSGTLNVLYMAYR